MLVTSHIMGNLLSPKIAHRNTGNGWRNNQHRYNILPTLIESTLTRWPKLCRKIIKLGTLPTNPVRTHLHRSKKLQMRTVLDPRDCEWRNLCECGNNAFMNLVRPQPFLGWFNSIQDPNIDPKSHIGMTEKIGCTSKGPPILYHTHDGEKINKNCPPYRNRSFPSTIPNLVSSGLSPTLWSRFFDSLSQTRLRDLDSLTS